jgi:hypothetical protein
MGWTLSWRLPRPPAPALRTPRGPSPGATLRRPCLSLWPRCRASATAAPLLRALFGGPRRSPGTRHSMLAILAKHRRFNATRALLASALGYHGCGAAVHAVVSRAVQGLGAGSSCRCAGGGSACPGRRHADYLRPWPVRGFVGAVAAGAAGRLLHSTYNNWVKTLLGSSRLAAVA